MSEKRFEVDGVEVERFMLVFGDGGTRIVDNQTGKELYAIDIVGLLNEQQATISQIRDEIDKKIAVLTDAEIKALQNEDEGLLMKIKFGIQILRELKEVINND